MNTKQFFRTAALMLVALAAMMPATMAAFDFQEGGIYYLVSGNEVAVTYETSNGGSYSGDVVIPETVSHAGVEYAVTAIANSAFSQCYGLTSIEIPNSIRSIGHHAFVHCEKLQQVVIPNSVISLGRCAFHSCKGLKSAVIGNSVPVIDEYAFQYCYQLTDVVIGSSVTRLETKPFFDCYALRNVTCLAPTPPQMIEWYSFDGSNYNNVTVHVPGGSLAAYKADPYWGLFKSYVSLTKATSITLDQALVTLNGGEEVQLTATVLPADASGALQWASNNTNVATVDASGVVRGVGSGEAIITATTLDGTELSAQCVVRVRSTGVQRDNVLTLPPVVMVESGMNYELPVTMRNLAGISALQCDLVLPEGIELAQEDGHYLIDVNSERLASSHTLSIRQLPSGDLRILITSLVADPFNGNDGDLFVLHLNVASDAQEGLYPVQINNVVMADVNALTYHAPDVAANFVVKNTLKGDANGDGMVDVGDYVTTANYIMELNPEPFMFKGADVDENGTIDVGDLVGITNIIMGDYEPNAEPESEGGVEMVGTCANSGNTCTMTLELTNDMALTAWQMDISLPEGMTLQQAALTSRAAGHYLVMAGQENGRVKLLGSSPLNAEVLGNEGALLTLTLDNNCGDGEVTFDNIVLAEPDMTTHRVGAFKVNAEGSSVKEIKSDVRIYAQGDNIIVETPVETTVELITPNGMTRVEKAKAGINTYRADRGIIIVRAAGQVAKFRI